MNATSQNYNPLLTIKQFLICIRQLLTVIKFHIQTDTKNSV